MENASKALIIAGAILISIVIISLGVVIVNNVTGIINDSADMSAQEVAAFNSKFENYAGTRKGSAVKALLNDIQQHNYSQEDGSLDINVNALGTAAADTAATDADGVMGATASDIKSGLTYEVSFGKDPKSGRITVCGIVQK